MNAGQKAHSKMCHKTLHHRPRSFVVRGEREKKKDFEQYWLMGLCIYNSFPFTTPSQGAEHKLNFTCASNSYIIFWQILSQQGTDHKAATKNT